MKTLTLKMGGMGMRGGGANGNGRKSVGNIQLEDSLFEENIHIPYMVF